MVLKYKPVNELNLRLLESPIGLEGRELIKKACLSIGLISPNDSRDVIVDVFWVVIRSSKLNKSLSSEEIRDEVIEIRKEENLLLKGTSGSNIRRSLKILIDFGLVERISSKYRIIGFEDAYLVLERVSLKKFNKIISRSKEYLDLI